VILRKEKEKKYIRDSACFFIYVTILLRIRTKLNRFSILGSYLNMFISSDGLDLFLSYHYCLYRLQ